MELIPLFENTSEQQQHAAGNVIFEAGDPGKVMYVVLEGEVEIRLNDKPVSTVGPGEFFGEMALLEPGPRSASAVARSDCRLAPVSQARFLLLAQQTPQFSLHVMRVLVERLRQAGSQLRDC
jgi:CRP-like cAMP-binding protein